MSENIGNAITRLPMDRLVRNLGGRIQPTPLLQNLFLILVVTANRTVNVLVVMGCNIVQCKSVHNFDETWMTVCRCVTKKKSGRKTANINTKEP